MINKLLTTFNRSESIGSNADFGEKIGNIGLGLLRIGFGKTVTMRKISDNTDKTILTKNVHSTSFRVVAIALFILALPVTILLAGIGCLGVAFSQSHEKIFNLYIQFDTKKSDSPRDVTKKAKSLKTKSSKHVRFVDNAEVRIITATSPLSEDGKPQSSKILEENSEIIQLRKIPPVGNFDTVISPGKSLHGTGELFSEDEIVEKLNIIDQIEISPKIYVSYTRNKKVIIQQQATRGCTAATAAMLIMDNGKQPDLIALQTRNLGDNEHQIRDIAKAGLKPLLNSAKNLLELRNLILENDSCIVSISGKIGGHVVVVDEVSEDLSKIRLRDPYHGWEITVTSEAFLEEWHGGSAIQILNKLN